jgi:hypothetical protein
MEHGMQEQLLVMGSGFPEENELREPSEQMFAEHKKEWKLWNGGPKPHSGMWTSTFMDDKRGSAWVQLGLRGGGVGNFNPCAGSWQSWKLIVDDKACVYHIDSAEAFDKLLRQYPLPLSRSGLYPDWDKVRQDYHAVHLTESGFLALKERLPGWDCESTVWFKWKFLDVIDLGKLPFVKV